MNLNFFLPKQPEFFVYFDEYGDCLNEMANLFKKFTHNFNNFEEYFEEARVIEHEGDKICRKIIDKLNRTIITPFDREDIHLIARKTDRLIDLTENVIRNIYFYKPKEKIEAVTEFSDLICRATMNTTKLLKLLKKMKYTSEVKKLVMENHKLEDRGDLVFKKSIVKLFEDEKDPANIIKWKDILENMESIMDRCKNLSNVIEGVIIKSS